MEYNNDDFIYHPHKFKRGHQKLISTIHPPDWVVLQREKKDKIALDILMHQEYEKIENQILEYYGTYGSIDLFSINYLIYNFRRYFPNNSRNVDVGYFDDKVLNLIEFIKLDALSPIRSLSELYNLIKEVEKSIKRWVYNKQHPDVFKVFPEGVFLHFRKYNILLSESESLLVDIAKNYSSMVSFYKIEIRKLKEAVQVIVSLQSSVEKNATEINDELIKWAIIVNDLYYIVGEVENIVDKIERPTKIKNENTSLLTAQDACFIHYYLHKTSPDKFPGVFNGNANKIGEMYEVSPGKLKGFWELVSNESYRTRSESLRSKGEIKKCYNKCIEYLEQHNYDSALELAKSEKELFLSNSY